MHRPAAIRTVAALLAALILSAILPGCKAKPAPELVMDTPEGAWQSFRTHYCSAPDATGLLVKASLLYTRTTPRKRTNRTLVSLWGNFDGPMRLDLKAGMGKLLAHIREDERELLVFYPMDKRAYAHMDPVLGSTRLGMPFPFSLSELARVTVGDFSGLVPETFSAAERTNKGFAFVLRGAVASTLLLDVTGRPLFLGGNTTSRAGETGEWGLEVNAYEENDPVEAFPLPGRVTLTTDRGEKGVLRIKARELRIRAWSEKSTGLELPDDIVYHRLDSGLVRHK